MTAICEECGEIFDSSKQLRGHKSIHRRDGRYSVSRKRFPDKECKNCGSPVRHPKVYCNNRCQRLHEWATITRPKIERGECKTDSSAVLRYLIERDEYKCSCCGIGSWNGKFLTLDIDHVDGNNKNNKPENLRFLCPNCHRQTPTWGNNKIGEVPMIYEIAMRLL